MPASATRRASQGVKLQRKQSRTRKTQKGDTAIEHQIVEMIIDAANRHPEEIVARHGEEELRKRGKYALQCLLDEATL